jgi:hypothetical protein
VSSAVLDIDQEPKDRAADFAMRAEDHAAWVERAYRRAVGAGGFDQGEYRRWQRPRDADPQWSSRVLLWVRALIAGPWCLSRGTGELVRVLLEALLADSGVVVTVEVRLIRAAGDQAEMVVVAVSDTRTSTDEARVRLIGVAATDEPDAVSWDVPGLLVVPGGAAVAPAIERLGGSAPACGGEAG